MSLQAHRAARLFHLRKRQIDAHELGCSRMISPPLLPYLRNRSRALAATGRRCRPVSIQPTGRLCFSHGLELTARAHAHPAGCNAEVTSSAATCGKRAAEICKPPLTDAALGGRDCTTGTSGTTSLAIRRFEAWRSFRGRCEQRVEEELEGVVRLTAKMGAEAEQHDLAAAERAPDPRRLPRPVLLCPQCPATG